MILKTKERLELQIQTGLLDIKSFLLLYPFFELPEDEELDPEAKFRAQMMRFRDFVANHPTFPIKKVGRMAVIPIKDLIKWLEEKEAQKEERRRTMRIKSVKI